MLPDKNSISKKSQASLNTSSLYDFPAKPKLLWSKKLLRKKEGNVKW